MVFGRALTNRSIAPWFCLRLPSCGRGFKSQAHHLSFFNLYYWNCNEKRTKINKKRPGLAHKKTNRYRISITSFGLLDGPLEEDLNSFLEKDIFWQKMAVRVSTFLIPFPKDHFQSQAITIKTKKYLNWKVRERKNQFC